METPIPQPREIEAKPMTIRDNINYITEKDVQSLFLSTMERIKSIDEKHVEEKTGNWAIGYWISGRKFCELYPKRKFSAVGYKTDENEQKWDWDTNVTEEEQINEMYLYSWCKKPRDFTRLAQEIELMGDKVINKVLKLGYYYYSLVKIMGLCPM